MRWFIILLVAVFQSSRHITQGYTKRNIQRSGSEDSFECGVSNPGALSVRELNEDKAEFGEFPWVVAIIKNSDTLLNGWSDNDYISAGSIIHPSVVITSTRRIEDTKANEIKCRAGEWDKTNNNEEYEYQERDVKKIVNHPRYFSDSLFNSISLLFLKEAYELASAPHIGTVCVGQALPPPGLVCYGTGWGLASSQTKTDTLKKIPVEILSKDRCTTLMNDESRFSPFFILHDSLTCASSNVTSCRGDGGAPLVCKIGDNTNTRYTLFGISAYRLGHPGSPCMYVKVPKFHEWIGQQMAVEGLGSASYSYQPTFISG